MTTSLSEDADAYDIRREALKRVREQAEAAKEIQGEVSFFYSARAKLMEAAIRKEIQDKKDSKKKEEAKAAQDLKDDFKVEDKPPVADSSGIIAAPSRVPSREELFNMLSLIDRNYKFLFQQLAGLNNDLDVKQLQIKELTDEIKALKETVKLLQESKQ